MGRDTRSKPLWQIRAGLVGMAAALIAAVAIQAPSQARTAPVAPVAQAGDDWARIKASGKLLVGSSLDYPPFAYYNPDFTADGFDLALMREIGKRLGVAIEFNDFAFEGVLGALQLKQVDASIAAISITPERQTQVDFSTPYYAGEDAILAIAGSGVSVRTLNDLAGKKIGVQNGSIYAGWLRDVLVEKNLLSAGELLQYSQMNAAIRDLKNKQLDLVVTDLLPAQSFVRTGGVELVGQGLNRQQFGITVRKGSGELLRQINTALTAIRNDGTFNRLTQKYLKVSGAVVQPPTTPAQPVPTVAPPTAAPAVCVDGMSFVADLNLDDRNMTVPPIMTPSQSFSKSWRVRNSGNCNWSANYALAFSYGNSPLAQMGGTRAPTGRTVAPGETVDFSVNLVAPNVPGTYQGFWNMKNAAGVAFGEAVWVGIRIPGPPTPVPPPPSTGGSIVFNASRTSIRAGEGVVLSWNVQNVNGVYFYVQGDGNWPNTGVAGVDSRTVYPSQTTVYELRVALRDGGTDIRQIRIDVQASTNAPVIAYFNTNITQINAGQCVNLNWSAQGQVDRVNLFQNGALLYDYAPVNGSFAQCIGAPGYYTLELDVSGPGGVTRRQLGINVGGSVPVIQATLTPIP